MIKSGSLSMNFINKIMAFTELQKMYSEYNKYVTKDKNGEKLTEDEKRKLKDYKNMNLIRWRWNMAYDLTRFAENASSTRDKEAKDFVKSVMTNAFANTYESNNLLSKTGYHYLQLLQMACRWAELEKRTQEE